MTKDQLEIYCLSTIANAILTNNEFLLTAMEFYKDQPLEVIVAKAALKQYKALLTEKNASIP
jgi:hypothetical protein